MIGELGPCHRPRRAVVRATLSKDERKLADVRELTQAYSKRPADAYQAASLCAAGGLTALSAPLQATT